MNKKLIGIIALCIISVTTAGYFINKSFSVNGDNNVTPKDTLISLADYKPKHEDIRADVSKTYISQEELENNSALIVTGKLIKAKGIAMTLADFPCTVYELEISDTIANNVDNKDDVINLAVSNIVMNGVDLNDKIGLDREYLFYLSDLAETFPHLKEKYYGLIDDDQGLIAADLYK